MPFFAGVSSLRLFAKIASVVLFALVATQSLATALPAPARVPLGAWLGKWYWASDGQPVFQEQREVLILNCNGTYRAWFEGIDGVYLVRITDQSVSGTGGGMYSKRLIEGLSPIEELVGVFWLAKTLTLDDYLLASLIVPADGVVKERVFFGMRAPPEGFQNWWEEVIGCSDLP